MGLPLWSSGQSSWLQIQRPGFDSQHYQIFWGVVGLEWGPLNRVSTVELVGRNSSGYSLEIREYDHGDLLNWQCDTLYQQKMTLTSLSSGSRSANIICSRNKATEFSFPYELHGADSVPSRGMHVSCGHHSQTGSGSHQHTYPVSSGRSLKLTLLSFLPWDLWNLDSYHYPFFYIFIV
jgi:hypothetical protein